ncbi:MAG: Hpt domain-containing protein, partial [Lachnospiraceae bacterium]|nr:Hpt domain-containing protein [Lachnospiraceae bacterium]
DDIERFYDGEKWEDYRIAVHGLKSSARTIGANELSDIAERLEKAAADVEIETIKADNDRMLKLYKSYLEKLDAAGIIKNI